MKRRQNTGTNGRWTFRAEACGSLQGVRFDRGCLFLFGVVQNVDAVAGVADVGPRPAPRGVLREEALAVGAPSAVGDPGGHVVREVAGVALVVEGELFDRAVADLYLVEFVAQVPLVFAARTGDHGRAIQVLLGEVPVVVGVGH